MNRYWWAAVAAVAVVAADSRADFGGVPPGPPPGGYGGPTGPAPGMYGYNPIFHSLFWWKKKDCVGPGCAGTVGSGQIGSMYDIPKSATMPGQQFGPGGPGLGGPPEAAYPGTPPNQMPGTLVFPRNPYVRSPRDFFMYEPGGR